MITTDKGVRVYAGSRTQEGGLSAEEADDSVRDRNRRAADMGITTRYMKVPFKPVGKDD